MNKKMNLGMSEDHIKKNLPFEGKTDLTQFLDTQIGFRVHDQTVYYKEEALGRIFKKYGLYKFLEEYGILWQDVLSKRLLPDYGIFVVNTSTVFIIEYIFQQDADIVDKKLLGCDFKKKQYQKLFSRADIEVEYIYLLSDWFKKPEYKDVLDYIISVRCRFYFEYIPLSMLVSQFQRKSNRLVDGDFRVNALKIVPFAVWSKDNRNIQPILYTRV